MRHYLGKRFAAFLLCVGAVTVGFFAGPVEAFSTFATTIGLLYTVYLGGQSATDWKTGTSTSVAVQKEGNGNG